MGPAQHKMLGKDLLMWVKEMPEGEVCVVCGEGREQPPEPPRQKRASLPMMQLALGV